MLLLFVFLSSLPDGLVILAAAFDDRLRSHWYCTETVRFASVWPAALTDGACAWGRRACNLLPEIVTPHSPRLLNGTCHRSTAWSARRIAGRPGTLDPGHAVIQTVGLRPHPQSLEIKFHLHPLTSTALSLSSSQIPTLYSNFKCGDNPARQRKGST